MVYDLDFNTLYGAATGNVEQAQDVMQQLFDLLKSQKREGFTDWQGSGSEYPWMGSGGLGAVGKRKNLQQWQSWLDPESEGYGGWAEDSQLGGITALLGEMLQGSGIMDLASGYGQDVADISTEMGSKLGGLQKKYTTKTKGGRYSKIGTSGRNVGLGGRSKYMSDIYGLQQKEAEMQRNLQDEFSEDFYGNLATWQGLNVPPISEG